MDIIKSDDVRYNIIMKAGVYMKSVSSTKTKRIVRNIVLMMAILMSIMPCADSSAKAKKLPITTENGYTISKLQKPKVLNQINDSFAKMGDKGLFATAQGGFDFEKEGEKPYRIVWGPDGKAKLNKLNKTMDGGLLKGDDKGRFYYCKDIKKGELYVKHLYVNDSKGNIIKDINISKIMKKYLKKNERAVNGSLCIKDYDIKGDYIDCIILEYRNGIYYAYNPVFSIQTFNWRTGKRVKATKLKYAFEKIRDGYLYGTADDSQGEYSQREHYGYNLPIEKGYYKFTKDGKQCVWKLECDRIFRYDVTGEKIIYIDESGIYSLNTKEESTPKLLVSSDEFDKLKKMCKFYFVFAFGEDEIYLPYSAPGEDPCNEITAVYKIQREE